MRSADRVRKCLLLRVDPTSSTGGQTDANGRKRMRRSRPLAIRCSNAGKSYWPVSCENWQRSLLQMFSATRAASVTKVVSGWPQRSCWGERWLARIADLIPAKALGATTGDVRCPHGSAQVLPPQRCDPDADRKL